MTQLIAAGVSFVLALIAGITGAFWADWGLKALPLGLSVLLVSWFFGNIVILQLMAMWRDSQMKITALNSRIDAYETTDLRFVFVEGIEPYQRDIHLGDDTLGERLWRIGVRGSKGTLTKGVVVRLELVAGAVIRDLPQILHPMKSLWQGSPTEWQGDGSFDIRPGDIEHVDVIRFRPSHGQENDRLEIVLQSYAYTTVPYHTLTLTLSAQANQGQAITGRFILEVNPKGLTRFYPLDPISESYLQPCVK